MKRTLTLLATTILLSLSAFAQQAPFDSTRKNTVRINITPMLITGPKSFTMGYERVLWKRQTISANIGHLQLPALIKTPTGAPIEWISNARNTGAIASVDYRFYFNRNKYAAPDGLYWGPYLTYYYIDNTSTVNLLENEALKGTANVQLYSNIAMLGLQMGYQFIVFKRFTIDLIFIGPGAGFYNFDLSLDADFKAEDGYEEYLQGIYDALIGIFPGAEQLLEEQSISNNGVAKFNSFGFRYLVQIGYRF